MHSIWFGFARMISSSTPEAILVSSLVLPAAFSGKVFVFLAHGSIRFSGACSRIHDPKLKER